MSELAAAGLQRFKPYPEYRDSGVEWLGEIPEHWNVTRTKFAARLRSGHTPSRQQPEYWQNCTIPWFGLADVWQIRDGQTEYVTDTAEKISELGLANSAARLLPKGTVMLSRTASVGFSAIMGVDMATTQDFVNWVCGASLRSEYLLYVFRSMQAELSRLTMGSTHQTIYMPDVARFSTPIPPIREQDRIVDFVREHAKKIDALVAKKERLIELLQEKRAALITRAVTRGLDPNVPMKDSGVEWLGDIPAHWDVKRLKHIALAPDSGIQMGPFGSMLKELVFSDTGYKLYGQENTISGDFEKGSRWLTEQQYQDLGDYRIHEGDIVVTRKGSIGNARIVPRDCEPGIIDSDTIRIRVDNDAMAQPFLTLLLHEAWYVHQQIGTVRRGAVLGGLNTTTIADLIVAVPPREEQGRLIGRIQSHRASMDGLIYTIRHAIDRLKEFRTALIFAAVTGKIDVREESAA